MLKVKFVDFPDSYTRDITIPMLQDAFGDVQECDDPEFLFYSVFGNEHLKYDCVRIFWTGENIQPDFNICDYAIGFSHMTYEDRYMRIPLYYFYERDYQMARKKHLISNEEIEKKIKFCNFVYSNKDASPEREQFLDLLSEYKKVDSGGRYRNNVGGPVQDKYEFQLGYKFSIAFENSSTSGYTTEKILQAFSAGTIPIYWGNPKVGEDFNEKAFINCHNYKSLDEVVEVVKKIDNDNKLFKKYLMQPIGNVDQFPENSLEKYREYVIYICKQNPKDAIRRNNVFWGEKYQSRMKRFYTWEEKYKKVKKLYSSIKKRFRL